MGIRGVRRSTEPASVAVQYLAYALRQRRSIPEMSIAVKSLLLSRWFPEKSFEFRGSEYLGLKLLSLIDEIP